MLTRNRAMMFATLLTALLVAGCTGDPPTIKVTSRDAQGLTEAGMDSEWLAELERWTRSAAAERLDESYARNEVPPEARVSEPRLASSFVTIGGKRLALVTIAYTGFPLRVARVTGLRDGELVTVSCTSPGGAAPEPTDPESECGQVVQRELVSD